MMRLPLHPTFSTASPVLLTFCLVIAPSLLIAPGCSSLWKPKSEESENEARLRELLQEPEPPDLVREAAVANGLHAIQVDGVGAVTKLPGTGGPSNPSAFRDELIEEMKRHDIKNPNRFLESNDNALVRVRALIPPGARRGDPIDVRVLAPPESKATNLESGWLLDTRLRRQIRLQKRMMQTSVHSGDVLVVATGPVISRGSHTIGDDVATRIEGNVISGGRLQEDRKLSLVLRPKFQHVKLAERVAHAINERFYFFDGSTRRGIAVPREDDLISIDVHPRYRKNVYRMMEVVRAVSVEPESSKTQTRLSDLGKQMLDPATAADAALQLEAFGESAVPTLLEVLNTENPELRFYAAEALAYLDRKEAIAPLQEAAVNEAAFRAPALIALEGFDHPFAIRSLRQMTTEQSLETRYGAFCSLRRRRDARPTLGGESLGAFWLYQVNSEADPAIVVSLRESPELVIFGEVPAISLTQFLRGPGGILIKADASSVDDVGNVTRLKISRFQVGKEDKRSTASMNAASLIRALSIVGASYGETVEVLRMLKDRNEITGQLAIDPLPRSLRTYYRGEEATDDE